MKLSGAIVLLIGLVSLLFFGVIALQTDTIGTTNSTPARQDMMIPLIMGLAALAVGAIMLIYGGRGYVTLPKDPQIAASGFPRI